MDEMNGILNSGKVCSIKSRAKKYGSEPGFDIKNEVRKEKWILKNSSKHCLI